MVIITITPLVFQAVIYTLSLSLYKGAFFRLVRGWKNNNRERTIIGRGTPERQGGRPLLPTSGKTVPRVSRGEENNNREEKKIQDVIFWYDIQFSLRQKMEEENNPWDKLLKDLMAFEILENRLRSCKACFCVGIDADGRPFRIIHGDQSLLDVERSDDPKAT